jgi:hypothetical protein
MFLVVVSTIDVIWMYLIEPFMTQGTEAGGTSASSIFRIFRLMRVFKFAKVWPTFNTFIITIGNVMYAIIPFAILLFLFMFSFTILGLEAFAHTLRFDVNNKLVPYFEENPPETSAKFSTPDSNFDSFGTAMITVFVVMTGDGWAEIYHNHYRAVSGFQATIYFLSIIVLGQWVLFNLLLANLLKEYDNVSEN